MRLFSNTPKSSPELVRHSQVCRTKSEDRIEDAAPTISGGSTPPREHSPALVRGVSTLGRKFSRRFEKFGESETARRLRMASPSRKYHWSISSTSLNLDAGSNPGSTGQPSPNPQKKRVSRVDSFRNFFSLASSTVANSTLRTPRAVKRRSRNTESKRQSRFVDVGTSMTSAAAPNSLPGGLNSRFGSEATLTDCGQSELALSECQSEADLRYYCSATEDEMDERSVVSDGLGRLRSRDASNFSRSAGNLRLGILPENRAISFQESGVIYHSTADGMELKNYGLIDKAGPNGNAKAVPSLSHESGYSSDNNSGSSPNSSSRASPRASLDGELKPGSTGSTSSDDARSLTPQPNQAKPEPKQTPPKKPARKTIPRVDSEERNGNGNCNGNVPSLPGRSAERTVKDYKMVRLAKPTGAELGIIIAKKKLKDIQTTGFQIVHIEPNGLVDR